jgi:Uma2 family endonuclease
MRHLFTVDEYERMGQAGIFPVGQRLELLGGEIIEMAPIGSPHAAVVNRLNHLLVVAVGDRAVVTVQNPVRLGDISEPQPDVAVARFRDDYYGSAHPQPADLLLVIEVSDTTVRWDRATKRPFYARAGIREVWIVDLAAGVLEVATDPGPDDYREIQVLAPGQRVSPSALPDVTIDIDSIFG